ncbi:aldo/keto reductase [Streptomyces sp. CNQ431]|uniref:aldo/keto reductase n=1 Tax=Streptomyces sp. CNQ431 TaxID=1571532 RepID=UPI00053D4B75|nr:aldo/keto reductase [Streptomyces sp. CNQ431]
MTTPPPHPSALDSGTWQLADDLPAVRRVGYGSMRLPGPLDGPGTDRERALRVLRRAVELGVNHIDTAAFYFSTNRSANELINAALAPYAEDLVIVTKVGPGRDTWGGWHWASPEQLRGQVEENLRQLGRDHLDVVNFRVARQRTNQSLAELREAGLVRHLGVSNVRPRHLAEARSIAPVVCVQNPYGVGAGAEEQEFVQECGEAGIAYVPFFSIAGARREAGAGEPAEAVRAVAEAHGATPAQVQLAWTLQQGPHVLAIPGTTDPAHLEENVAAGSLRLNEAELELLGTPAA